MDLKWKIVSSETRGDLRCTVFAARIADGHVWRTRYTRIGRKGAWAGQDIWEGGTPDELLKERFGLTLEGCVLHTQEQLQETLQLVAA